MDDQHWGLTARPFQLTPDARFWFETATHRKAMAYLGYGLAQGEGFIVVTGEVGAGKTTLVGHLLGTIDESRLNPIRIVSTAVAPEDLLRTVALQLDADPVDLTKAELLAVIEQGLHAVARSGRRTLLVVDEAQALPLESLEELRMLSNFQAGGYALLQILLLGQPEFRDRLNDGAGLEQLRQRIIASHHLEAMEPHEVASYIAHRLTVVGWTGRPDFSEDSFDALHEASGGIPRRLNQIASRVMLHAALTGEEVVDADIVGMVLADLAEDLPGVVRSAIARVGEVPPTDPTARLAALEARVEEQETVLRRVLTMLIDWVETDPPRAIVSDKTGVRGWRASNDAA
ncbi:AAA family ATPase [Sphingomonas sp. S-NIH.Pt15_0812]|uniref:ExeA family protein n=1 Tax=Sphingomonas sp. S-NIH.Pt15_0812 TaxID=1920129 RepID=UPI000F7F0511|nr:AAA family ATPase [Sphingomonas sp. S-NIH.Pt15_0812]RSU48331.1 general secretion pathway protein [Sphingomonas sp. S-NIH.Pt15_0812]